MFPYSTDTSNYYQYFLADHLGNTRVSFDTPHDTLKVEQQDDYMPFGMEIAQGSIANPKNEYLYNKKELQESTGLYDYGARFYDPVVGRWTSVDPNAENYESTSSYAYVLNNPINLGDLNGRDTTHLKEVFVYATKLPKPKPIVIEPLKKIEPIPQFIVPPHRHF